MHSAADLARLKSNRRAVQHFAKFRPLYLDYARHVRAMLSLYPKTTTQDRAFMVARMIRSMDPNIWGLATGTMTAEELCSLFASLVVGHEDDKGGDLQ